MVILGMGVVSPREIPKLSVRDEGFSKGNEQGMNGSRPI